MRIINKLLFSVLAVLVLAVACTNKEDAYVPGEAEADGCYGVYFPAQAPGGAYEPADDFVFEVTLDRTNESGAISVPVSVEGTGAQYVSLGAVTFNDGQKEVTVKGSFSKDIPQNETFDVCISIQDPQYVSKYSSNPSFVSFDLVVESWKYLGKGSFWDLWLAYDEFEVDFYQNEGDNSRYRVVNPYKSLWDVCAEDYLAGGWQLCDYSEKVEFQVMKSGDVLHEGTDFETTLDRDDIVYYEPIKMGLFHPSYSSAVYCYNPADLSTTTGNSANLVNNRVDNWQDPDSEGNQIPSVVYLAGYRYMPGIGGWGGYESTDEAIVFQFPGGVFVDYSLDVTTGTSVEGELPIEFTTGKDVVSVDFCIYEGELTSKEIRTKKALIAAGEETDAEELDMETKLFTFQADTTCRFTIVAVAYDKNDEEQSNFSGTFGYVKKGDEEKVEIIAGASLALPSEAYQALGYEPTNNLMFNLYGQGITAVSIKFVTEEDFKKDADSCWKLVSPVKDAIVSSTNNPGGYTGIVSSLKPNTCYYLLAEFNNGYQVKQFSASCTTDGLPVEKVGTGTYTLNAFFEGDVENRELYFDPNTEQSYFIKDFVEYGSDFNFEWVAATDSLIIPIPQIMTSSSNYGAIYFGEVLDFCNYLYGSSAPAAIAYYEANGMEITSIAGTSKYDKDAKKFSFALFYYAEAGYIGSGVETYQLDPVSDSFTKVSSTDIHWVKAITPSVDLNFDNVVWDLPAVERTVKAATYTKGVYNGPSVRTARHMTNIIKDIE